MPQLMFPHQIINEDESPAICVFDKIKTIQLLFQTYLSNKTTAISHSIKQENLLPLK